MVTAGDQRLLSRGANRATRDAENPIGTSWNWRNPVDIRFGPGALETVGELTASRRYSLITYADEPFRHLTHRIASLAGPPTLVIDDVTPNPTMAALEDMAQRLQVMPAFPQLLIALGGGSVIDTAKVLAVAHAERSSIAECLRRPSPTARALPVIAIPTTAGTGSEVTRWATIWAPETGRKLSLDRSDLYPEAAIVDPVLALGLPREPTIASGLDSLSHALESLWNIRATPMTRGMAITAAATILEALPLLVRRLDDPHLRARMAEASLLAGLAFSGTRTALAHALSYPFTLHHGVTHGIACSFTLPSVMHAALGREAACDAAIDTAFGVPATDAPEMLEHWLHDLGIATHPAAHGASETEWRDILGQAFSSDRGHNFIGLQSDFPDFIFSQIPAKGVRP
jgi:phosphonate metabolism-associated iron-containing alcohol dehydrogenase